MKDETLKIIFSGVTNLLVAGFIGAAWLLDKVTAAEALIPLLAVSGLELAGRAKTFKAPPAGPTAAALFYALQAVNLPIFV